MRKTTVNTAPLLAISHTLLSGFIKKLCRSYGVAIIVASMIELLIILRTIPYFIKSKSKNVPGGYALQASKHFLLTLILGLMSTYGGYAQVDSKQVEEKKKEQLELEARVRNTLKENGQTIRFLENKGQVDNKNVLYYFEGTEGGVYIERDRIRFVAIKDTLIARPHADEEGDEEIEEETTRAITASHTFSLYLDGANLNPGIKLGDSFTTNYNYFIGGDSKGWASGVKASKELTLEDIYPGIDLRLYSTSNGEMEFDWLMDAGADFRKVKMQFKGQDELTVDQEGNLKVGLRFTKVKFGTPESYQVTMQGKVPVKFSFNKLDQQHVEFTTQSNIDPRYPTVIDPTLTWGTFLDAENATFDAYLFAIQVDDADGMVYCAGETNRPIPTGAAPYDADGYLNNVTGLIGAPSSPLPMVAVIYRVNATGTDLVDLTLYGPSAPAASDKITAYGLSLSATKVFISGVTNASIPIAGTPFDGTLNSGDGFVAVFSRDLGTLSYSTYLGGSGNETIGATSIRALNDNSFVTGMTVNAALPASFISAGAPSGTFGGGTDMYIAKFTSLNVLSLGTYVGGTGNEEFNDLEVFTDGRIAFAGSGTGQIGEVNSAANRSTSTDFDGILGVINSTGTGFNYLDEIGGTGADRINDVEIVDNTLFWTGSVSSGFPVSASGVYDISHNGSTDVVVGKVGVAGGAATYGATFYGTPSADLGNCIKLVSETNCQGIQTVFLLVFGTVGGTGLPVLNINGETFYRSTFTSGGTSNVDMFFAGFTNTLSTLLYGTYMGGNQDDYLGETGSPRGSNHLWVNNANVFLGTTTHSATHLPVLVAGGFDLTKSNGTNDSHLLLSIEFHTIIESDYSDAPATYGSPSHILDCQDLHIGPLLDPEAGSFPGAPANGDDTNGLDDEDGITTLPTFAAGGPQNISVTVSSLVNTTGFVANLYGWIDFNSDGQFSASEFATTTLANGFTGSKTLTWSNVTVSGAASGHYLRIRLTRNTLNDNTGTAAVDERSTLAASSGEVEDYLAIELTCPAPANEAACQTQATINTKYATWLTTVKAGGGCSGVLTNNSTGAPSACGGSKTVIFTFTSACSPATTTCSATFTVATDAAPVITTCAVTRNISGCNTSAINGPVYATTTTASTEAVFENVTNLGVANDGCGITAVTYIDVATGTCPIIVTRRWTITDICGNTAACNQTINITENVVPSVVCPVNVTISCTSSTLPAITGTATSADNCTASPIVTFTDVITSLPTCAQEYTITRTWRATDNCGNFSTCNQLITIDDNTPPIINCPVNITLGCLINTLPANTGTPTSSDNCGSTPVLTFTDVTVASGQPGEYSITRTWKATDACGNTSTCNQSISVVDNTPPVVTSQPNNVNECVGGTAQMTVVISGGSGTLNYQWQSSTNGTSGWVNASGPGSTTTTYTPPSTVAGTTYYRIFVSSTGNGCGQTVSNNATAVISPDLTVTTQPGNVTECIGGTNTMNVVIAGGSGAIAYQWQSSPNGSNGWANATGTGSTSATFTPPSTVAGTTYYRVLVNASNSNCDQTVSNSATAIISPDVTITTQPSNIDECIGGTNSMTVVASISSGTITYQWQSSPNGTNGWANASGVGSTTATFTPPSVTAGTTYYRVLVNASNNGCDQAVSNNGIAVVTPDLLISVQPTPVNECIGATNTMNVAVTGGSGTNTYQWQSSSNGTSGWTNATGAGATTSTYMPNSSVEGTTYYRVLVNASNNGCDQVVSNTVAAIIVENVNITAQPQSVIECVGGTTAVTITAAGGSGNVSYQWQQSLNGTTGWTDVTGAGATTATYTPPSTTTGTLYYRVIITSN